MPPKTDGGSIRSLRGFRYRSFAFQMLMERETVTVGR
jgi:hypothetical protein